MAALSPIPTPRTSSCCGICGCDNVDVDHVEDASLLVEGTAFMLALYECPRCEHRWTKSVWLPTPSRAQDVAVRRVLHGLPVSISNAA